MYRFVTLFFLISCTAFGVSLDDLTYSISNGGVQITGCDQLAAGDLDIPASIEGLPVTSIGEYAFYLCESLTSITIPSSVTSIGEYAFYSCTSLTSIVIPEGVTSLSPFALSYCDDLTSVTLPESLASIGEEAFAVSTNLASITIPAAVTSIGDRAFASCRNLEGIYFEGRLAPTLGIDVFIYITQATTVNYPVGATGYTDPFGGLPASESKLVCGRV